MDGLEVVARDSLTRMESRFSEQLSDSFNGEKEEGALAYFADFMQVDEDERNWSIPNLRRQLRIKDSGRLFRRYQMRVQHALFVELLLMNVIVNGIILLLLYSTRFLIHNDHINSESLETHRICRIIALSANSALFVVALFRESWFTATSYVRTGAAVVTLATMTLAELGPSALSASRGEHEELSAFYVVLASSVLLPFSRKLHGAVVISAVIVAELFLTAIVGQCGDHKSAMHLFREGLYLTVALMTGLCMRFLMEVMGRRSFLDRRECLESKIKTDTEKEREDNLLHSLLPLHVVHEFRDDFRSLVRMMVQSKSCSFSTYGSTLGRSRPFNKLYVERYTNVSILYADIVNSMLLCACLQVCDLVDTLDDLFGRFDKIAETNNCMRIKLLGDCYYCVAGLPDKGSCTRRTCHHADDCVHTGILMILVIRQVREKRGIDVDMRIGIHSGRILGGLLGLKKWQYDVWSRDVTIASHLEQAGKPGFVHITKDTLDLLTEEYEEILPGDGHLRDQYLAQEGIRTFLVPPIPGNHGKLTSVEKQILKYRRGSLSSGDDDWRVTDSLVAVSRRSQDSQFLGLRPQRRRAVLDYSLFDFHKIINEVNRKMEKAVIKMQLGKIDQWCSSVAVNPCLLTFEEWRLLELRYLKQPDPLFKYYIACSLFLFVGIFLLQLTTLFHSQNLGMARNSTTITTSGVNWANAASWMMHGITFILILSVSCTSWIGYISLLCKNDDQDVITRRQSYLLKLSRQVWKNTSVRHLLWCVVSVMILTCSLLGFHMNSYPNSDGGASHKLYHNTSGAVTFPCEPDRWLHTACITLALTTTSVFIRIHYLLKLLLKCGGLIIFCTVRTSGRGSKEFSSEDSHHCFYLGLIVLVLHLLDRQIEYVCRLDFVWRWRLSKEQEEVRTVELGNQMLLNNILPAHVKQFYLSNGKFLHGETPYHEECSSAAILFASIPNFSNFYFEDDLNEGGRRCIQLLNEIVCDFDLLLFEKRFSRVEKIKTIGSTYMAACGLRKREEEEQTQADGRRETEQTIRSGNVVTLAHFATEMMAKLQQMNKDALQELQLRIGLAAGRVMAGVVGSMRPQFDIWGDPVNVASRMDSTGVTGRIQVTEEVADILRENGFQCECRGEIFVKGKGELITYFLKTCFDGQNCEDTRL